LQLRPAIGAALIVLLGVPTVARAQVSDDEIVGILHFEADGISETVAQRFEQSIEAGLADNGFKVAPRKRLLELLGRSSYVAGCRFGPCLEEVYRNTDIRLVLVGRVTAVGPSYTVLMTLLDTRVGRPTSQVVDRCEVCTVEEAMTGATLAVVELVTGAGTAVVDPALGPTSRDKIPDFRAQLAARRNELADRRRRLRRAALFFVGAAALAGGAGGYLIATDRDQRGLPAVGAAGAFAVASATFLVLSRRF
jgi:hypothetical protein